MSKCTLCGMTYIPYLGHECRDTNYKKLVTAYQARLAPNMFRYAGEYKHHTEDELVDKLRAGLLRQRRLQMTPVLRRSCVDLGIEPTLKNIRKYVEE